jgi:flagellar motor switch protein FliN
MSQDEVSPVASETVASPFEELGAPRMPCISGADAAADPLAALYDLSLPISIELGRTSMMVQEVLQLGRGSVIELDRIIGEPVDIFVGDRRFAEGEVVVLGENFGVRITRILPGSGTADGT